MLYRITWWKNTVLAIFLRWQLQLRTRRPIHIGGTIPPCYIRWLERKFQGAKIPGCESSMEQKFQGAKVPGIESSTPGTFAPGSEWSWERKVHNSFWLRCQYLPSDWWESLWKPSCGEEIISRKPTLKCVYGFLGFIQKRPGASVLRMTWKVWDCPKRIHHPGING